MVFGKKVFPGSDSHRIIGHSHTPPRVLKPGFAHNVARLGELEITGIITIDSS